MLAYRTALHWACKRNHTSIIRFLIANGADSNIKTFKNESAASLASSEEALLVMDCLLEETVEKLMLESQNTVPIVPNYLKNPPFPYGDMVHHDLEQAPDKDSAKPFLSTESPMQSTSETISNGDGGCEARTGITRECTSDLANPLVLKLRVHGSQESDFIEVEIASLTYQGLLETCAEELEVDISTIAKIRKLPNVLVRKDRDVCRMSTGQELEVVLTYS